MDLEPRLLRAFVAVAAERHFGRAAERLALTQPTLTRQIQELEARVGARLLDRRPRAVDLTEPGRVLLGRAERLLEDGERALDETRRAARGSVGHLSLGFLASTAETLGPVMRTIRGRHPGLTFTFTERPWAEQTAGLESGEDDLAFVRDLPLGAPWQRIELGRDALCVVLPADHRLARLERLRPHDLRTLADTPFVTSRRWMQGREERWGFVPRVADDVVSVAASFALVRAGLGVSLMPLGYARSAVEGVVFVVVEGETSRLELAWPGEPDRPARETFITMLRH